MVQVVVAGAINWDINLFVGKFPKAGEERPVLRVTRVPGGKGGNVAVAAARLLGLGQVGILGALGRDEIAGAQIQFLKDEGVDTSAISLKADTESGQAYIVTDQSGENIIHTYFAANAALTPGDLMCREVRDMIHSARITAITDPPEEIVEAITEAAQGAERLVAWDPGVRAETGMERLRKILLRVDYLFLNEIEVEYMTGASEPSKASRLLWKINPDLVPIIKSGREGCIAFKNRVAVRVPGIAISEHGLRAINTVGCGDAFLGAFSAAKALNLSDEVALQWANWAGALKATKAETRGSPTRTELEARITRANRIRSP